MGGDARLHCCGIVVSGDAQSLELIADSLQVRVHRCLVEWVGLVLWDGEVLDVRSNEERHKGRQIRL